MSKAVEGERKDKLKHVRLADIVFGDRAREDYGDLEELKQSITENGIIQPISISGDMRLLAGGRRYTACTELGFTTIPAIVLDVDDLGAKEIELLENIHRKDFTWQERAKLTREIDDLRRIKDPNWNQRKTAELTGMSQPLANLDIQLAKAMDIIPEIGECKTADDARKMLKKMAEREAIAELRQRQEAQSTAPNIANGVDKAVAAMIKQAKENYIVGNTFDGMAKMKSNGHISIIECDPPYGIDLNSQKASKDSVTSTVTGYKEVPEEVYDDFLNRLATDLYRVAGKDCWLVFWYGPSWHAAVLAALRNAGWAVDEIPAIWAKPNGQTLQPGLYYARCYEPFFLCRKGNPVMAKQGRSNVFAFSGASDKYHPTQRPVELIEEILETLSVGMDTVFVPFLGSGATLRACYNRGLKCFGYDLDGKYKDQFLVTVEQDTRQLFKG